MEAATPEAVTIGPVPSERRAEFITALGIPFGFDPDEGYTKRLNRYFEWDRALAAYVDDRVGGTIGAFSLDLTVPGGTGSPSSRTLPLSVVVSVPVSTWSGPASTTGAALTPTVSVFVPVSVSGSVSGSVFRSVGELGSDFR